MTCNEIIAAYFATLKNGFSCEKLQNGRLAIVTPFLYPDHDNIELFVRERRDGIVVSDLGETLRYLDTSGMDILENQNLLFAAKRIADGFDARIQDGIILKEGESAHIGQFIFDVLSACSAVASFIYSNKAYEPARFEDEVSAFLSENGFETIRDVPVSGLSATKYKVDFQVAPAPDGPFIQVVSPKTSGGIKARVNSAYRMWSDLALPVTKKLNLLNDDILQFKDEDVNVLSRVSTVCRWTDRDNLPAIIKRGFAA